ncbi:2-keto-4-pentenoate hydratase [Rhodococcus fascians]|uniref:2-keto-4-pentenoate hydratase n=1 Tax=Nocardiaceae TaxID=85025 RepID=UPI00068B04A8|nr:MULTISPECIES: fumarylacetoacetate hydrolase family protein [Rhodococcus]MDR6910777.1 2-keto-4-pentenoate hydratase [Rhodococcus sp. 3258]MDR6931856.1 2-keto-4-pentenoate hydratase [Rhodococcus fascians]
MTVEPELIEKAAERLMGAALSGTPCAPVRDLIGPADIDAAYLVQSQNIGEHERKGHRRVGRKIGLTSPSVQAQIGVDQPDFGVLLDFMDCTGDGAIDIARLMQPRIEAEVAFVLSTDIDREISAADAPSFVREIAAAFEIVDSRVENWNISLADTVADNASSGLFVLGDSIAVADAPELSEVTMTSVSGGVVVSSGRGSDCLGSPWNSLAWLANTSLRYGAPLRAGEIILSGALGPLAEVAPGSDFSGHIAGIGSVEAIFTHSRQSDLEHQKVGNTWLG